MAFIREEGTLDECGGVDEEEEDEELDNGNADDIEELKAEVEVENRNDIRFSCSEIKQYQRYMA